MACLDTTCLIDWTGRAGRALQQRARAAILRRVQTGERLTTTRFNVAEMLVGSCRARNPAAELEKIELVLSGLVVLEFDAVSARLFAQITADLQRRGRPIGDMDVLIAAVAMSHGQTLVTRDVGHFRAVPGLEIVEY